MEKLSPRGFSAEDLKSGKVITTEVGGEVNLDQLKPESAETLKIDLDKMPDEEFENFVYGIRPKNNRYNQET